MTVSRSTQQKETLTKAIARFHEPFTAETLALVVPKIGIATIYRFLKQERKRGTLHTYQCNEKTLYSREAISHCHFTCHGCGKIWHIKLGSFKGLDKQLPGKLCHVQIDATGWCRDCAK